jgi:hypothetical protein
MQRERGITKPHENWNGLKTLHPLHFSAVIKHLGFWYVKVSKTVAVATVLKTTFSSPVYALRKQVM